MLLRVTRNNNIFRSTMRFVNHIFPILALVTFTPLIFMWSQNIVTSIGNYVAYWFENLNSTFLREYNWKSQRRIIVPVLINIK